MKKIPYYLGGWGMYLHDYEVARRVRTDRRWDVGVGAGGGKPGSNAMVWRSLVVDQPVDVEPAERGQHNNNN
jgi:hypothetical protein